MSIGYCPICDAGTGYYHTPDADSCLFNPEYQKRKERERWERENT